MVHHKRLVFILAVGFILMSAAAVISLLWPEPSLPSNTAPVISQSSERPVLGKPCSYRGEDKVYDPGLQCYFYGEALEEGTSRPAIWVTPDLSSVRVPSSDLKTNITWKTYENKDYGFSFVYPADSTLGVLTVGGPLWQARLTASADEPSSYITIQVNNKEDNYFTSDSLKDISSVTEDQEFANQNGLEGMVRKIFYQTSLRNPSLEYDLNLSDKYDLWVMYDRGLGSDYDYINDVIVQSLKAIK